MAFTVTIDLAPVAHGTSLPLIQVESVVRLLDAGNTIPFITRYRKDQTGGLDEEQIRLIQDSVSRLRTLAERKQTILRSIEGQGKLTPELAKAIETADSIKRLEDLYLPFKPKKQTLATIARERKLEPLANEILSASPQAANLDQRAADFIDPDRQVNSVADVLLGVGHILAEDFSERADLRGRLRKIVKRSGQLVSAKTDIAEQQGKEFRDYFEFRESLSKIPPHRVLAINRGERAKMLRVKIEADEAAMRQEAESLLVPPEHLHAEFIKACAKDALERLVFPSLEREIRREMTEAAEAHAVEVFAKNLRNLLLMAPVRGRKVLAVDPGFKSGCKLAALDEFGNLIDHAVIHLVGKEERKAEGRAKIVELIKQHNLQLIALGNGTACRETEEIIGELLAGDLKDSGVAYVIVNEAGASVYSTSPIGREELPQYDAILRSSISIGRRLLDPLSELVKIDPGSLGVGLYQHDVKAKHLRVSLDAVVESCVNYVGVDLNTSSPALLRYVSGLNQLTARRLYDHRIANGPFRNREQLKEVPGFGEAAFVQAAGFLKIVDGDNPLDATWIHPESYDVAKQVLEKQGFTLDAMRQKETTATLEQRVAELNAEQLAADLHAGQLTLRDILSQLTRPGRDPREDLPPPIFKSGVLKLDDLQPGMELLGSVLNVVDFGAFVDIGLHDSGLVHVSQLANRFVRDPHEVVSVGDIVKVWVMEIDKTRRRVSLTMIAPGTPKYEPRPKTAKVEGGKNEGQQGAGQQGDGRGQRHDRRPRRERPPRPQGQGGPRPEAAPGGAAASAGGSTASPPQGIAASGELSTGNAPPRRDNRPPRFNQRRSDRPHGKPQHQQGKFQPKPKPKPLVPISEKMKKGQAPLRTFGDLLQFSRYQEGGEEALAALGVGKQEEKKARPKPKPAQQPSPEVVLKGDAAAANDGQRSAPEDRSFDASCVADVAEPSQTSAVSLTTPTAEQPATEPSPSAEKPEPSESPS